MRHAQRLRIALAAALLAVAALGASSGTAFAYGAADHPIAQVELSANCNDPSFGLCQQVGLGGIWLWLEIDANGTGDIAGAGCGHIPGGGGGAGSIRGTFSWVSGSAADVATAHGFLAGVDPHNAYYVVSLGRDGVFGFPKTVGHYSAHPVAAVTIQLQVAP